MRNMPERPILRKMHSTIQEESDSESDAFNEEQCDSVIEHLAALSSPSESSSLMRRRSSPDTILHATSPHIRSHHNPSYSRRLAAPRDPSLSPMPGSPLSYRSSDDDTSTTSFRFPHRFSDEKMADMMEICTLSTGRARFGDVIKMIERRTMHEYAVSKRREDTTTWSQARINAFCHEMEDFASFEHRYISKFFGHYIGKSEIIFFRTFTPSGTVEDRIKQEPLKERDVIKYLTQTLEALQFCHNYQPRILHRNIKASNLLLAISGDILLCDFGVDNIQHENEEQATSEHSCPPTSTKPSSFLANPSHFRRTLLVTAPELLPRVHDETAYTEATDIWAVGCLLVEMMTALPPYAEFFADIDDNTLHEKLTTLSRSDTPLQYTSTALVRTCTRKVGDILDAIFVYDDQARPSAKELLSQAALHPNGDITLSVPQPKRKPNLRIHIPDPLKPNDKLADKIRANQFEVDEKVDKMEIFEPADDQVSTNFTEEGAVYVSNEFQWVGVVLLAAVTLATVASLVFLAIFLIYYGIGVIFQVNLNEGFIVLIALILLPILILLTTLCCNNSIEKYKEAVENRELEKCKYVYPQPDDDIVLCGVIVVEGSRKQHKESVRRKNADSQPEGSALAAGLRMTSEFAKGVSKLA